MLTPFQSFNDTFFSSSSSSSLDKFWKEFERIKTTRVYKKSILHWRTYGIWRERKITALLSQQYTTLFRFSLIQFMHANIIIILQSMTQTLFADFFLVRMFNVQHQSIHARWTGKKLLCAFLRLLSCFQINAFYCTVVVLFV